MGVVNPLVKLLPAVVAAHARPRPRMAALPAPRQLVMEASDAQLSILASISAVVGAAALDFSVRGGPALKYVEPFRVY